MQDSSLVKLIRLCNSISSDPNILKEFQEEIEGRTKDKILTSMIRNVLKNTNLDGLGVVHGILPLFFQERTITEIDLYNSSGLGIKCFFMSKETYFPLHDHPNQAVITSVLYGNVRHMSLNKTQDPNTLIVNSKGSGIVGDIMFNTLNHKNVHTILALTNSVILDVFMHNANEAGSFYKVLKKKGKNFTVCKDEHVHFLTRSWKVSNCDCLES
ncbi:hypothetical protein SteCoe_10559 [Stentor coeruleus]|uniref:Cysteine dioxygenase n=1 Tax=Stentor coeruleus TaxID=5963 RepID=A0A1R2CFC8_9CILI|nr:hypothetical protein SteCoe_10559 [Stentor coeruleus]